MTSATPVARKRSTRPDRHVSQRADAPMARDSYTYNLNVVQDRIREWQAQGIAAIPPDAVSTISVPASNNCQFSTFSRPETPGIENRSPKTESPAPRGRDAKRLDDLEREEWLRQGRASTPRKRVVSDEHWRKTRTKPATPETKDRRSFTTQQPTISKKEDKKVIVEGKTEREERRQRRLEARRKAAPQINGHKAESSPLQSRDYTSNTVKLDADIDSNVGDRTGRDSERDQLSEMSYEWRSQPDHNHDNLPINSKYAATLGQMPQYAPHAAPKSKKGVFGKTKEMLGMNATDVLPTNPMTTIEAWLYEQPEHSSEPNTPKAQPESGLKDKPSRERRKRTSQRRTSVVAPATDPNKIWESVSSNSQLRSAQDSPNVSALAEPTAGEIDPNQSPAALQRRGARASRSKQSKRQRATSNINIFQDHNEHQLFSSTDVSSVKGDHFFDKLNSQEAMAVIPDAATPARFFPPTNHAHEAKTCSLSRKLTTHEDLISELSRPRPSRRIRRGDSDKAPDGQSRTAAIQTILKTAKDDDADYSRELRTLVDGVIPVLLQSMLSKDSSLAAASLFTASDGSHDPSFSRSVIDMGIALERLKALHGRLSTQNVDRLLSWCQTAHRAYSDYVAAWRLGFQDVVVNLAPMTTSQDDPKDIMERDKQGDIVGADGEKVDVAFLLKRPLIRIRKLSKTLASLKEVLEDHVVATKIADDYNELTAQAKRRHQQEQGRLEDEAAAQIDVTKTRDIRTLGCLPNVTIQRNRVVRARDIFDVTICHSTGQRMDSKVEMIIRDNKPGDAAGGDVLICQIDEHGKWLLFAPVELVNISARRGESGSDLVVMVRGKADLRGEWHELLVLAPEEADTIADWINMLGSKPLPPKLAQVPKVNEEISAAFSQSQRDSTNLTTAALARVPSLETIDVPIGESSVIGAQYPRAAPEVSGPLAEKSLPKISFGGGLQQKVIPKHWGQQSSIPPRKPVTSSAQSPYKPKVSSATDMSMPHRLKDSIHSSERQSRSTKRFSTSIIPASVNSADDIGPTSEITFSTASPQEQPQRVRDDTKKVKHVSLILPTTSVISEEHSSIVSTPPSTDNPTISKIRDTSKRKSFSSMPLTDTIREKWAAMSGRGKKFETDVAGSASPNGALTAVSTEASPQHARRKDRASMPIEKDSSSPERSASLVDIRQLQTAIPFKNAALAPLLEGPPPPVKSVISLKSASITNDYSTSTASETIDDEDSDYSDGSSSDTSEDLFSELKDDLRSLPDMNRRRPLSKQPPSHHSMPPTTGTRTLAPSDSASQGPYRSVPSSGAYPSSRKEWAVAMVCTWSDNGTWEPVGLEESAILVSPGLVEAFSLSHLYTDEVIPTKPIVAFELTPIVPLRKGTALDITIRSPPLARSQITTTNNVMFRSRSLTDCEALYRLINWARCNNPTYLELERSRPQPQPQITFSNQQSERPKSWFSFGGLQRKNTYRAGSAPPVSIADSAASVGTMSNAMTMLKRFSRSSAFSINRSSVVRRPGRASNQSLFSDTHTGSGSGSSTPAPPTQVGFDPGKDGPNVPQTSAQAVNGGGMVNNMKIKLFLRQGQDWKPLGNCRLSVLPAPLNNTPEASRPGSSAGGPPEVSNAAVNASPQRQSVSLNTTPRREYRLPSSSHTPHRIHGDGREKRILVTQKDRADIVLLDEVLGESCFEKVAERGIAVKVWTEDERMRNAGGVLTGRGRVYMLQFSGQSEASWVFGLCGTYRYGHGSDGH